MSPESPQPTHHVHGNQANPRQEAPYLEAVQTLVAPPHLPGPYRSPEAQGQVSTSR